MLLSLFLLFAFYDMQHQCMLPLQKILINIKCWAVALRNDLFGRIKPEEKDNPSLVRKHYAALRNDLMIRIDGMFEKLSGICKA